MIFEEKKTLESTTFMDFDVDSVEVYMQVQQVPNDTEPLMSQ